MPHSGNGAYHFEGLTSPGIRRRRCTDRRAGLAGTVRISGVKRVERGAFLGQIRNGFHRAPQTLSSLHLAINLKNLAQGKLAPPFALLAESNASQVRAKRAMDFAHILQVASG